MPVASIVLFVSVYALAVVSPGPAVAAVVARAARGGAMRTAPFIAGIVLGDMVWLAAVALGLSALAQRVEGPFSIIRYAGAAYLVYLAWKSWTAPVDAGAPAPAAFGDGLRGALGGLSLTLGNPKVMVFFLAVLPSVIDIDGIGPLALAEMLGCVAIVLGGTMSAYAALGARAGRLVSKPSRLRLLNRATGGVMAGAAVAIVARS
ncbi:MAG: LysE family translocator [Methylobacteriaceae bacterium]|nr:LysE family translocator [Rhodoblastus sp.]MCC0004405.1 LysE family translocator [Methylobacteriaceae bacterium]